MDTGTLDARIFYGEELDTPMFIEQTYRILTLSLLVMLASGVLSYFALPLRTIGPIGGVDGLLWILCGWLGVRQPIRAIFSVFTVVTGLFLGLLARVYVQAGLGHLFLYAGGLTIGIFLVLSAYVHATKEDFRWLTGFLIVSFFVLLGGGLCIAIMGASKAVNIAYASLGVLSFCAWILYDTSRMIHRWEEDEYEEEPLTPAVAAFELFLDIIGLFRWLLRLLTNVRD